MINRKTIKNYILAQRKRLILALAVVSILLMSVGGSFAQSVSIALQPEDLDNFFTWFNTMFSVILPIALIGAGLVAGAAFAFVVGNMLKKAFQSLAGGSA